MGLAADERRRAGTPELAPTRPCEKHERIVALERAVESLTITRHRFASLGFWGRLRWLFTGEIGRD